MSHIDSPLTNRLIPSYGPPTAGSGLEAAVAPNSPWRWWASEGVWVSQPIDVSWGVGAEMAIIAAPSAGSLGALIGGRGTNPSDVRAAANTTGLGNPTTDASWNGSAMIYGPSQGFQTTTATTAGTGTAYLFWSLQPELADPAGTAYTGTNTDTLPTETRTVADIIGADFTVTQPSYAWTEEQIGNPGDWALDLNSYTGDMWGPRDETGWGGGPEYQIGGVLISPDGSRFRLVVANDGTLSTEPA